MKTTITLICLLFTVAVSGQTEHNYMDKPVLDHFMNTFNLLLHEYYGDCYNDSTKVEVHQPTQEQLQKDPCEITYLAMGQGIQTTCTNGRHMTIQYLHADPKDFGRFLIWLEKKEE